MKKTRLAVLAGVLAGVLLLAAFRLVLIPPEEPVHYHANFALFVGGERIDLSADEYMEEVGACRVSDAVLPTERAHLHNNKADVAHVHHEGVTWRHLLANLGFGLGRDYLVTGQDRVLVPEQGNALKFILNGRPEFSVHNELIRSGDRLLISYGSESEEEALRNQFPTVASTAEEFNRRLDPAGCSGAHEPTLWDRGRHAFGG